MSKEIKKKSSGKPPRAKFRELSEHEREHEYECMLALKGEHTRFINETHEQAALRKQKEAEGS